MNFYLSNIKMEFYGLQQEQYFFLKKVLDSNINEDDFIDIFYYYFNKPINKPELSNKYVKLLSGRYYNNEKEYYIEYYNNNLANWDIKKGIFKFKNVNKFNNLRNWFFSEIIDPFSLTCVKHGKIVIHGSLWEKDGKGIIICGESGSGKSTLSYLAKDEINILSDDVLIVTYCDETVYCEPINAGFGLKQSVINPFPSYQDNDVIVIAKDKIYLKTMNSKVSRVNKIPLDKIFILNKNTSENTCIQKLPYSLSIKAFIDLQTNIPNPFFKLKFELLKKIIEKCPVLVSRYSDKCDINLLLKNI